MDEPPNNNEIKATVFVSPSNTVVINATGQKANLIKCVTLGGGTFVGGTNENNAAVYITVYETGIRCVSDPGSYDSTFFCQYRPNVEDPATPIYGNTSGSITFTTITDNYMEGFFSAVCSNGLDSVIVTGTFKGDRVN
jgi:hypothetical protein